MSYDITYATATHILAVMAYYEDKWVTSNTMAESIQTNPGLVRRVLSQLSDAGLVITKPGPHGGARLARSTDKINLAEVYEAVVEQPVLKTSNREPYEPCRVSRGIGGALEGVFSDAEVAMKDKLKQTTLDQIMQKI
ncbi:MAG: Rrf2 family transcriptional regulator [Chloroflexota bacterium]